ncbi:hypothetical protein NMK71_05215 [Weeksellaceae bacterium KMM 9713]|uniref:DUF4296 domain-containing protein n=1 Tax=Profundicola chukchiensis TaxID=2961959 RepID=A0A9X4MYC2_9FLAO|nr:hypothetical protein [Profundicola chukchiensis]MDG4945805.1 hypothetical protein [Profundicola chukchiensis]
MKKVFKTLIVFTIICSTSCQNNDFQAIDHRVSLMTEADYAESQIATKYFNYKYKEDGPSFRFNTLYRDLYRDPKRIAYQKMRDDPSLTLDHAIKLVKEEYENILKQDRESYLNDLKRFRKDQDEKYKLVENKLNKFDLTTNITLKNNLEETIEDVYISTVIYFEFNSGNKIYLNTFKIDSSKFESKNLKNYTYHNAVPFAEGDSEFLSIHKPKKIEMKVYSIFENSIGYSNKKKNTDVIIDISRYPFGRIMDEQSYEKLIENDEKYLGVFLFKEDITSLYQ